MRFICPYCKSETTTLHEHRRAFSKGKCKSCGKRYLIMPLAIPEEQKDSWDCAREEATEDCIVVGLFALGIIALAVGLIIGIGYLLT